FVEAHEHGFFALDGFSGNFRRQQELRVAGRDVHRDVFSQFNVTALQDDSNTDLVTVQVSTDHVTFNANQTTDVDVLADFTNQNKTISFTRFDQRSSISQFVSKSLFDAGSNEHFEVVLQSQEVGLRVHFQQNCDFTIVLDSDCAFSSNVACFFGCLDGARSTHVIN